LSEVDYKGRLYDYLEALIHEDPKGAKDVVEHFSEYLPFLDVFAANPSQEWAYNIVHSDHMNLFLAGIDWERPNPPRQITQDEELPSLMGILEVISLREWD
jgi:hypothetical protein